MENAYIFNYNFQSKTFEWFNFSYIYSTHISQYIRMCIYHNTFLCFSVFCAILSLQKIKIVIDLVLQIHYIFNYFFIKYKYHQTFFIYNRLLIKLLLFSFFGNPDQNYPLSCVYLSTQHLLIHSLCKTYNISLERLYTYLYQHIWTAAIL